jgi:hypothetical protein
MAAETTDDLVQGSITPSRAVNTTAPLAGGGALSSDLTLTLTTSPASQTPVGVTRSLATTAPVTGGGDLSADRTIALSYATANGADIGKPINSISEEITLATGATTTDSSADLLPANSLILGVVARVTTTITADATGWELGDGTTAARFSSNNTNLTANDASKTYGLNHWQGGVSTDATGPVQVAAAKLRVTCAGGNPGAGKVRVTVYYLPFVAPTT